MTTQTEAISLEQAAKLALEALEDPYGLDEYNRSISDNAITALREALAEQQAVSRATYNRLRYDYNDLLKKSKRDAKDAKRWREHVNHCQLQGVDLDHNFAQRKENT